MGGRKCTSVALARLSVTLWLVSNVLKYFAKSGAANSIALRTRSSWKRWRGRHLWLNEQSVRPSSELPVPTHLLRSVRSPHPNCAQQSPCSL